MFDNKIHRVTKAHRCLFPRTPDCWKQKRNWRSRSDVILRQENYRKKLKQKKSIVPKSLDSVFQTFQVLERNEYPQKTLLGPKLTITNHHLVHKLTTTNHHLVHKLTTTNHHPVHKLTTTNHHPVHKLTTSNHHPVQELTKPKQKNHQSEIFKSAAVSSGLNIRDPEQF